MDTLPPFVHADSTAIASSGKHFDALLSKSIQNSAVDPSDSSQYNSIGENTINSTINALKNSDQLSVTVCETNKCNSVTSDESKLVIDEDYLEDIKPIFNNNAYEINPSVSSVDSIVSNISHTTNPGTFVASSFCSQLNNVTSSNDVNDESITCLPCHLSFNSENEFKCHMKTHVQSVLLGDVNSSDLALNHHVSSGSAVSITSVSSDASSILASNSKDKRSRNQKYNHNSFDAGTILVKTELSDSEIENCLSPKKNSTELPVPSLSFSEDKLSKSSKLFCPVCKIYLQGKEAFRKHAGKHDSYSLLKLYCEALDSKDIASVDQNLISNVSSKIPFENHRNSFDKSSYQKSQNAKFQPRNNMINNKLNNHKYPSKRFHCIQCRKKFSNKTLFIYHQQLHLNTKGFSCGCCKKSFSSKILLLSHTRSNHFKTFSCANCSRVFNYRKLFDMHKKNCVYKYDLKTSNGSQINFPVISIESLLNSDMDGIVGIIPVCNTTNANERNSVKVGIPVMSIAQIKALHQFSSNSCKQ